MNKSAKCPNCSGNLQVSPGKDTVKCMYCGTAIFVKQAVDRAVVGDIARGGHDLGKREEVVPLDEDAVNSHVLPQLGNNEPGTSSSTSPQLSGFSVKNEMALSTKRTSYNSCGTPSEHDMRNGVCTKCGCSQEFIEAKVSQRKSLLKSKKTGDLPQSAQHAVPVETSLLTYLNSLFNKLIKLIKLIISGILLFILVFLLLVFFFRLFTSFFE